MSEERWKVYWIQTIKGETEAKYLGAISANGKVTLQIFEENINKEK